MPEDPDFENANLSAYQTALLEILSGALSSEEIAEALKTDSRFQQYQNYVSEFDTDMIEVARELMTKWAKRKE